MAEPVVVYALKIIIIAGASFEETITWKVDDVLVPFPAGTEAEAKIRRTLAETTAVVTFSTSPTASQGLIVLTDPGVATLSLTPELTAPLIPMEEAVFDIKYIFPTGETIIKLTNGQGLVDIRAAVTRP